MLEAVQLTGTVAPAAGPAVAVVGAFSVPTTAFTVPPPVEPKYPQPAALVPSIATSEPPRIRAHRIT